MYRGTDGYLGELARDLLEASEESATFFDLAMQKWQKKEKLQARWVEATQNPQFVFNSLRLNGEKVDAELANQVTAACLHVYTPANTSEEKFIEVHNTAGPLRMDASMKEVFDRYLLLRKGFGWPEDPVGEDDTKYTPLPGPPLIVFPLDEYEPGVDIAEYHTPGLREGT